MSMVRKAKGGAMSAKRARLQRKLASRKADATSKRQRAAQQSPITSPSLRSIRRAGLPIPANRQLQESGCKSFAQLQKQWYGKLEEAGFEDIEWADHSTGLGQNTPFLKNADSTKMRHAKPRAFEYYRLCAAYLEHNTYWPSKFRGDKLIWRLYTDGIVYRDINKAYNKKYPRAKRSLYYIFYRVKWHHARMIEWNSWNRDGLLNEGNSDIYAEDTLIHDPERLDSLPEV